MKHFKAGMCIVIMAATIIMAVGCGGDETSTTQTSTETPTEVVGEYAEAFADGDLDAINALIGNQYFIFTVTELDSEKRFSDVEFGEEVVTEDTATVEFTVTDTDGTETEGVEYLIRVNGSWKIDWEKATGPGEWRFANFYKATFSIEDPNS